MSDADTYATARRRLVETIRSDARETRRWTGRAQFAERVLEAIGRVPRHQFVAEGDEVAAYVNRPRAIGHGQTISQPYIVALMTDMLDLAGDERVLEIGTGSGYQAAVLSELVARVYTIEIVEPLALQARKRLKALGYDNVEVRVGDGYAGWPEEAPFDAVMVTAAPERIPEALVHQLKPGGRMIVPIGRAHDRQTLTLVVKDRQGRTRVTDVLPVAFVPMVRGKERN